MDKPSDEPKGIAQEVGELAAGFLDSIEGRYGDDAKVEAAGLVVAVDQGGSTTYHHHFTPSPISPHVAIGLLDQVVHQLRSRHSV